MHCPTCYHSLRGEGAACAHCGHVPEGAAGTVNVVEAMVAPLKDPRLKTVLLVAGCAGTVPLLLKSLPLLHGAAKPAAGLLYLLVLGYYMQVLWQVIHERRFTPLPSWDRLPAMLIGGIVAAILSFLWMLPFGCIFWMAAMLVMGIGSIFGGLGAWLGVLLMVPLGFFTCLLIPAALLPAVWMRYVGTGTVTAALSPRVVWRFIMNNLVGYLGLVAAFMGLTMLCQMVSVPIQTALYIVPLLGKFLAVFAASALSALVTILATCAQGNFYLQSRKPED